MFTTTMKINIKNYHISFANCEIGGNFDSRTIFSCYLQITISRDPKRATEKKKIKNKEKSNNAVKWLLLVRTDGKGISST